MNGISLAVFALGVVTFTAGMVMLGVADRTFGRAIASYEKTLRMSDDHRARLGEWTADDAPEARRPTP